MKKLLFAIALCAPLASAGAAEPEVKEFPAAGLESLDISAETGSVGVETSTGSVRVEISDNDPQKCILTAQVEGKKLLLKAEKIKKSHSFFSSSDNCGAAFLVYAPAALPLRAESGTGSLKVSGRSGETSLNAGTGSVSVHAVTGALRIQSGVGSVTGDACGGDLRVNGGTGRVELTGLCGSARVETGAGGVDLEWKKAPANGDVRVNTGVGGIRLAFPEDFSLSAKLRTGLGSIKNEFADKKGLLVRAESGTGSISVVKEAK